MIQEHIARRRLPSPGSFQVRRSMKPALQRSLAAAALVTGVLGMAPHAWAQFGGPVNPYQPGILPNNPLNPYVPGSYPPYPPYGYGYTTYGEVGGMLFGQADVLRAYGQALTSQEQARIMRQQSIQARLDTQRKRFELDMYIKANTPTFTEEQAK